MNVITIESEAYEELVSKINTIAKFVVEHQSTEVKNPDEEWVDSYEVCTFLNISERTLQRLRSNGIISYSRISGKTYYTIGEIRRVLNEKRIRSKEEALQNLIDNHQHYIQQRRNTKKKK
jgi:DNA-binding transcriptional MerR regulator